MDIYFIWLIVCMMVAFCAGATIGFTFGGNKQKLEIIRYYRKNRMKLLEEAVREMFLMDRG